MKKTMGLMLCMALLLSAVGCSGEEEVRGTIEEAATTAEAAENSDADADTDTEAEADAETEEEEAFEFGEVDANVYENKFIGIGCSLSDEWGFYSDEEIKELNNMATDMAGDEFAEAVADAQMIYDMYAVHSDGMSSINVNLENIGIAKIALVDVAESLESSKSILEDAFSNMGYEDISIESTTVTIDGEEFAALNVSASYSGMNMYELVFSGKAGKYMWTTTIGTFGEDSTQELFDTFYLVD
jgi:hypothetical protein